MERYDIDIEGIGVRISEFAPDQEGRREWHVTLEPDASLSNADFRTSLAGLEKAYQRIIAEFLPESASLTFSRAYLSDIYNQWDELHKSSLKIFSAVGQAPLSGAKIALLCWLQEDVEICGGERYPLTRHGIYSDVWLDFAPPAGNSFEATEMGLNVFHDLLSDAGGTLLRNAVRTWLFVRDIDINYRGVVEARNKIFAAQGLSSYSHFIASTGIGGDSVYRKESADTRAVPGPLTFTGYGVMPLAEGQLWHLRAADRMSPTHLYGVAFERGTAIDYGDRRHIFISGTASIDAHGDVMHKGDIRKQAERMLGNVKALLREGEADWGDVVHAAVYLRDISDYAAVKEIIRRELPGCPAVIVHGPVCRPEWLVEMECMAITPRKSQFADF